MCLKTRSNNCVCTVMLRIVLETGGVDTIPDNGTYYYFDVIKN